MVGQTACWPHPNGLVEEVVELVELVALSAGLRTAVMAHAGSTAFTMALVVELALDGPAARLPAVRVTVDSAAVEREAEAAAVAAALMVLMARSLEVAEEGLRAGAPTEHMAAEALPE